MAFEMVVSIGIGCGFRGKWFHHLGFTPINVDFTMGECLLVHLREFHIQRSRVRYTSLVQNWIFTSPYRPRLARNRNL